MMIKIVGYGIVGKNIHKIFPEAVIVDPALGYGIENQKDKAYITFICVPTPKTEKGKCDTKIVTQAIKENLSEYYCIKSTVPPGFTEKTCILLDKKIIFSPEYYGETINANSHNYNFLILGGKKDHCIPIAEIFKRKYIGKFKIVYTNSRTAELVKYMENCFLATKITFVQEFFRIAEKIDVNYDELRELFLLDPRINPSHTIVYRDEPFYDSKCLNKDIPGLIFFAQANGYDPLLIESVFECNNKFKKEKYVSTESNDKHKTNIIRKTGGST